MAKSFFFSGTSVGHTSPRDLARLIDYEIHPARGGETGLLLTLREHLVRWFGKEMVSSDDHVSGGLFPDVIVASGEAQLIDGGWGSDVVLADLAGNHTIDATRGDDTIVLSGSTINGLTTIVVDTESTLPSGKRMHKPTITIKDADAETATVVKLGDGLYEVADGDTVAVIQFVNPDGTPASVTDPSSDVFTFVGEFPDPEDSTAARPLLIVAEDVEGEALGSARSDVILAGALTSAVNGGAGDDVIVHDLSEASVEFAVLDGGPGDDTYVLQVNQSNVQETEECLIFDLTAGGLEPTPGDSAALLDFGAGATVSALGGALYAVTDDLGTEARIGFEFENGTALSIEQVRAVLLNADEFEFFRQDGTALPPDTDSRMTEALATPADFVAEAWDLVW